MIALNVKMGKM